MDEMISRAAAIEAIEKHIRTAEEPYQLTDADKVMNHAFEIAASCVYNLSAAETDVRTQMSSADCISRSGVSAWLANRGYRGLANKVMNEDRFPSAQPERKRGKWVFYEDRAPVWDIAGEKTWARAYKCSECSFVHSVIEDFGQYAFCPNCGADMREVDDERHD